MPLYVNRKVGEWVRIGEAVVTVERRSRAEGSSIQLAIEAPPHVLIERGPSGEHPEPIPMDPIGRALALVAAAARWVPPPGSRLIVFLDQSPMTVRATVVVGGLSETDFLVEPATVHADLDARARRLLARWRAVATGSFPARPIRLRTEDT
jgi:hypothetical protein